LEQDGALEDDKPRRMLNEKQVLALVPVGRTTLWRMERAGKFPKATYVSPNRRLWFESDVVAWQREIDGRGRGWRSDRERAAAAETEAAE
jgi:predicted DNA-binding transcriptional regulator AlpA